MGIPVLVIGRSGQGKSASLRNFEKNEVGVFNVLGKPLPFKNNLPIIKSSDYTDIKVKLLKAKSNTLVIDDAGYLMVNEFMGGHSEKTSGNGIFAFYNEIGDHFWDIVRYVVNALPDNRIVYFLMQEEQNDFGMIKPKTIGKMLDEKVCVEGMFTIVLRASLSCGKYIFRTQTDGTDVAKTPIGMFDKMEIENDLKAVDKAIREYYSLNEPQAQETEQPKEDKQ